ncbi:MAG TPA: hypothetical protein VF461_17665 [Gemmatimonadaceae bacterium]
MSNDMLSVEFPFGIVTVVTLGVQVTYVPEPEHDFVTVNGAVPPVHTTSHTWVGEGEVHEFWMTVVPLGLSVSVPGTAVMLNVFVVANPELMSVIVTLTLPVPGAVAMNVTVALTVPFVGTVVG